MSSTLLNPVSPINARAMRMHNKRAESPAYSEVSFRSSVESTGGPIANANVYRSPRLSLNSMQRETAMQQKSSASRRKYIANPDNKLDVAVGNVVNKLPVDISVQVVADTWKDQSGKYWIGDAEPRLCFCRILRSQTVDCGTEFTARYGCRIRYFLLTSSIGNAAGHDMMGVQISVCPVSTGYVRLCMSHGEGSKRGRGNLVRDISNGGSG